MLKRNEKSWQAWTALALALWMSVAAAADDDKEKEGLSLAAARRVELTTDEATWLSLDVSPDGTTIVFELLGDLYTLPIDGGAAARLTEGMAFDSQPAFSGDGAWIAFLSDRDGAENLWILPAAGGEPRKLSQEKKALFASPSWMPGDDYVLVSRSSGLRTYEVWMYHKLGGSGVQVTKAKTAPDTPRDRRHNALGAVASPDGRYLYYARKLGGFEYNATFPMWQIARRDFETGTEDVLIRAPGSAVRPVLSPDGTKLVYGTRHDTQTGLRARDLRTGEDRWLLYPVTRDDQESRFTRDLLPGYAFLPGGDELVVAVDGGIRRVALATGESREIPFEAEISQELAAPLRVEQRIEDGDTVRARRRRWRPSTTDRGPGVLLRSRLLA